LAVRVFAEQLDLPTDDLAELVVCCVTLVSALQRCGRVLPGGELA
jgi:hypothetical protein